MFITLKLEKPKGVLRCARSLLYTYTGNKSRFMTRRPRLILVVICRRSKMADFCLKMYFIVLNEAYCA